MSDHSAPVRSMHERMLAGEPCLPGDPQLTAMRARASGLLEHYNATSHAEPERRRTLLEELLGSVGAGVEINPSFRCDYGSAIHIGAGTFINYDCVFLDGAEIRIGAACQIAPQVQMITTNHAIDPVRRREGWEILAPITLADNVWLGGRVVVLPGVSIGADSIIGAGAVVARDIPAGVIAVGTPARVLREIDERDRFDLPAGAHPGDLRPPLPVPPGPAE